MLLRWDQIKFPRSLFIEQCAFFLIAAAPMLVASGHTYEIAGTDALLTGVVFVQLSALDHDKLDIVCVSVHSGVESGLELGDGGVRLSVRSPSDWGHGRPFISFSEVRLRG